MLATSTTAWLGLACLLAAAGPEAGPFSHWQARRAAPCLTSLEIDDCGDRVGHRHVGWPGRLSFIDAQDRAGVRGGGGRDMKRVAFVPLLSQAEAWKALPALEKGTQDRLPLWTLATAKALPGTTAAVLELEHRHRAASPLNAQLRGQIRFVVANANRCEYSQAQAAADLRRAGFGEPGLKKLKLDDNLLPPVLRFARKLTLAAYTVTDAEVAELVKTLGEKQLVAIVQLVAFSNFQDRLILALGIPPEPDGPLPPHAWHFATDAKAMARPAWPTAMAKNETLASDAEWRAFSFSDLKKGMETQKARPERIRVPTWDEVKASLPPAAQNRELRIKWSLVCMGYQPELAQGWSACTKAFRAEAGMDRVFEESLFWVVTRTLQCFY